MSSYNLSRYYRIKAEFIQRLGGVCVVCGTEKDLEFDHIDPDTKLYTIGEIMLHARSKVEAEVDKCQLLCKEHHLEKSMREGDLGAVEHGGGLSGKKNCPCAPCKARKAEYMRAYNSGAVV